LSCAESSTTSRHFAEFWIIEPETAFTDLSDNVALGYSLGARGCVQHRRTLHPAMARNGGFSMAAPIPPFTRETAIIKVRMAEDGWNSRDPHRVSLAYTEDSRWRNRAEFIDGRAEIIAFLTRKWNKELDYRLIKELWAFNDNRIAVRFAYEWHDDSGNWFRSYGNENWEFDAAGVMQRRLASINDLPINEADRKYHWPLGRRPDDHAGLSDLGL
jgi:nuclear transport factor 2 (NTF2) superfamily protein